MKRLVRHALMLATTVLVTFARADDSAFTFDENGNLLRQSPASLTIPQILAQPQAQVAQPGELASFFVVATDTRGLTYQWRFFGTNLSGATGDALMLTNVGALNEGPYTVVLTNFSGSITSAPAALMIDSDGDGLPDSWELAYFGNLTNNALGDFDHDGVSNLAEFLDGTNPTNSASALFRLTVLNDGGLVTYTPVKVAYTNGELVTLNATANAPEIFHGWIGDVVSPSNTITISMTTNRTVFAGFQPRTLVWTNTAGGSWNNPSNWNPNFIPTSVDDASIALGVTVTINQTAQCNNFHFSGGGTLTGGGTLIFYGDWTWTGGTLNGATIENAGTVLWGGGAVLALFNGAVFTNRPGSLFNVQSAAPTFGDNSRFDNNGTFRKSFNAGTTTFGSGVLFNNYGTTEIQTGALVLYSGGANAGAINISAGASLTFGSGTFSSSASGSITGAGDLIVTGSALVNLAGLVNVSGTNNFNNGIANLTGNYICTNNTLAIFVGFVNLSGTGTVSPSVLTMGGGALAGSQVVTVGNTMIWTGGNMLGTGRTVISPGAMLSIPNTTLLALDTRILENAGTVLWTGAPLLTLVNNAFITNRPGALFHIQNAAQIGGNNPVRFDNAGTFRNSAYTGTNVINLAFNNYGTLDIRSGSLQAGGGFVPFPGSMLNCVLGGVNAGTGYGQLIVAGSVALSGSLSAEFLPGFIPPTNQFFTLVSAVSRSGTFNSFLYPSNLVTMQLSNTPSSVNVSVTGYATNGPPHVVSDTVTAPLFYAGRVLTLSESVFGAQSFTFQWKKNATELVDDGRINGSHSSTLTISNISVADSGSFQLFVTNSQGTAQSSLLAATVQAVPKLNALGSGWTLQGTTAPIMNSNNVILTAGLGGTARSVFYNAPLYISAFNASFVYRDVGGNGADGFTFCLQNDARGAAALGGGLGYSSITPSLALAVNIYAPYTPGISFRQNGSIPATYLTTAPVNIASGNPIYVSLVYTSGVLRTTLIESNTANTFTTNFVVNLPTILGAETAYVGFTGGDGGIASTQVISNFTFVPLTALAADLTANQVVLSWPGTIGGYTLVTRSNLATGVDVWQGITNSINQISGRNQIIISPPSGIRFYRLSISLNE